MSDLKQKILSAMKHITPHDLAKMSPPELKDLHHKTKKALALHDEHAAATKSPGAMSTHEFSKWSNLQMAQGKE